MITPINQPIYGMMAISNKDTDFSSIELNKHLSVDSGLSMPIVDLSMPILTHQRRIDHNEAFLLHAIYKALIFECATLDETADWFNEMRYMLRNCIITDTRYFPPGGDGAFIDGIFIKCGYYPLSRSTLISIKNTVQDVFRR